MLEWYEPNLPIITQRLVLRPLNLEDIDMYIEVMKENFHILNKNFFWAERVPTPQMAEGSIRRFFGGIVSRNKFPLGIFIDGAFIGMCSIRKIEWWTPSGEIGYWCSQKYQNQGITTEAVCALTDYAFHTLGLKRMIICCSDENTGSCRVAEKSGYHLEARGLGLCPKPNLNALKMGRIYARFP